MAARSRQASSRATPSRYRMLRSYWQARPRRMTDAQLKSLEGAACPGAGACGGQFTANTMALVCEFLGIAPMGLSSVPATNAGKANAGHRAGELVLDLLRRDVTPSKIITKTAIENAITGVAATGGRRMPCCTCWPSPTKRKISLSIDDFDRISSRVPIIADLKPGGRFVATDLYAAGGTALVAKRLLEAGLLRGDSITVTGRTLAEEAADARKRPRSKLFRKLDAPLKPTAGSSSSREILPRRLRSKGCRPQSAEFPRPAPCLTTKKQLSPPWTRASSRREM